VRTPTSGHKISKDYLHQAKLHLINNVSWDPKAIKEEKHKVKIYQDMLYFLSTTPA
jgi:hypothetical protein